MDSSEVKDAIAIIGFSMRFPQEADSQQGFWDMLVKGRSAMTEVPTHRFNVDGYYSSDESRLDAIPCRGGHFLKEDVAFFDAPFFSMSAAEAQSMDPELRGLLETSYRAFNNAGISIDHAQSSNTSVYMGHISGEYEKLYGYDEEIQSKYRALGNSTAMMSNRISWFYDLKGPSMTIETACSSSLNALHLACDSLRRGESGMSLVGGSSMYLDPMASVIPLSNFNFLSPDSHCFSFDARANGYAKGEGFGVLVLKRLTDAINDGDTIRAVVRATSANQDGQTASITQPSPEAQARLITRAYQDHGLDFSQTRYFEAHGTGTAVGDGIEGDAIHRVFSTVRTADDPLYVGALKANIGHLEAAAGVASIIKTILILEKGIIPPIALLENVTPKIPAQEWNLVFPKSHTPWPTKGLRRASVNAFGYGGSNAHAVLDDALNFLRDRGLAGLHHTTDLADHDDGALQDGALQNGYHPNGSPQNASLQNRSLTNGNPHDSDNQSSSQSPELPHLLLWSASEEGGITRLADQFSQYISGISGDAPSQYLSDLAYTLAVKRNRLPWKSFALVSSLGEIRGGLHDALSKPVRSSVPPSIHFVFTGQGAQWAAMGLELLAFPVFRASLEEADSYLQGLGCQWSIIEELQKDSKITEMDEPALAQPICTALQVALVDLLATWQVYPESVVGHSSGEIAAAYSAGAISKGFAWAVAYLRGYFASKPASSKDGDLGAMMTVALSPEELEAHFDDINGAQTASGLSVGCENSPKSTTVTGTRSGIDALKTQLDEKHIFARKLNIPVAYHSHYMLRVAEEYERSIADTASPPPNGNGTGPALFSSVTGRRIGPEVLAKPEYWVRNLVSRVRFSEAVHELYVESMKASDRSIPGKSSYFVEVGPHAAMQRPVKDTLPSNAAVQYNGTLRRGVNSALTMKTLAGELLSLGYEVDAVAVNSHKGTSAHPKMLVDLPEYPFNHSQSYWLESRLSQTRRFRGKPRHSLLGNPSPDWNPSEAKWRYTIRQSEHRWIQDHMVNGDVLYPAAGMLVMAIEAARFLTADDSAIAAYRLRDVTIHNALLVPSDENGVETELHLRSPSNKSRESQLQSSWDFRLYTCRKGEWKIICTGLVTAERKTGPDELSTTTHAEQEQQRSEYKKSVQDCTEKVTPEQLYKTCHDMGIRFGQTFQTLHDIYFQKSSRTAIATSILEEWRSKLQAVKVEQTHVIHPTTLDSLFHLPIAILTDGGTRIIPTMVPTQIPDLWVSQDLLGMPQDRKLLSHGRVSKLLIREVDFAVTAFDSTTMKPVVSIQNARTTTVNAGQDRDDGAASNQRKLCYQMDWKPDLDLLRHDQAAAYCSGATGSLPIPTDSVVEVVCVYFMIQALETIPFEERSMLPEHLQKYLAWAEDFVRVNDGYNTLRRPEWVKVFGDDSSSEQFLTEFSATSPARRAWVEFGHNLVPILREEVNPLHLLFNKGLVNDIYKGPVFSYSLERLAAYIDLVAHKNSDTNILEVGAGTGSGTEPALRYLARHGRYADATPRYARYDYTDISPSFFEEASRRFAKHGNRMNYKTLDIESDPCEQGFQNGTYDVVIAVSCIHATQSIEKSLSYIQKLLRPGGHLLLMEPTNLHSAVIPFFAGVLPGWWRSIEPERALSAVFTKDQWNDALLRTGFSGVDLCLEDDANSSAHVCSFLSSTVAVVARPIQSPPQVVILAGDNSSQPAIARDIQTSLSSSGFSNVKVVSHASIGQASPDSILVSLLEFENSFLLDMDEKDYQSLRDIVNASSHQIWVTYGADKTVRRPESALIAGFGKSITLERPQFTFTHVNVEDTSSVGPTISKVLQKSWNAPQREVETDIAEWQGVLHVPRAIEAKAVNDDYNATFGRQQPVATPVDAESTTPLELQFTPGRLDNLHFAKDPTFDRPLGAGEVMVRTMATGLTFRDVMVVMKQLADDHIGHDFAGIVTQTGPGVSLRVGDRVCGIAREGSFRTFVRADEFSVLRIPDSLSFTDAASLPSAGSIANYGLNHLGRVRSGDIVLIHAAADYFGQLAIQFAQQKSAKVYATVRNAAEKQQLMQGYGIPEDHFFSSQTLAFAQHIMRRTSGRGVDVAFNSLPGDALIETWRIMAPLGRFVEIGKRDINEFALLPMAQFAKGVTFSAVDMGEVSQHDSRLMGQVMKEVEEMLFATPPALHAPYPVRVFKRSGFEDAFRQLQKGLTGKIVVDWSVEDVIHVIPSKEVKQQFKKDAAYVIAGGLGGIGRSIANWMVDQGATNLVLLSRSGAKSSAAKELVDKLRSKGANVLTPSCDITKERELVEVIQECQKSMPPIRGCVHSGMVVETDLFEKMSLDKFQASLKPKVQGTWNLHNNLPSDMDFFILLSSLAGVHGAPVQSNYSAGCAFQDAFARYRNSLGQHALSFDMGVVTTVGYIAERSDLAKSLSLSYTGHDVIDETDILFMMDYACGPESHNLPSAFESQLLSALTTPAQVAKSGLVQEHAWMQKPMFRHLFQMDKAPVDVKEGDAETLQYETLLKEAASLNEAAAIITTALVKRLSRSLMVPLEDIDANKPVYKYGVDSLVAVEIQFWFSKELKADISVIQILSGNTIAELGLLAAEKSAYFA